MGPRGPRPAPLPTFLCLCRARLAARCCSRAWSPRAVYELQQVLHPKETDHASPVLRAGPLLRLLFLPLGQP